MINRISGFLKNIITLPPNTRLSLYGTTCNSYLQRSLYKKQHEQQEEKTRQISRLLIVAEDLGQGEEIFITALQTCEYYLDNQTVVNIEKIDTSGHAAPRIFPSKNQEGGQSRSVAEALVKAYLDFIHATSRVNVSVFLFARAQPQYLFPNSKTVPGKHVLNDRQLIIWWKRVLSGFSCLVENPSMQHFWIIPGLAPSEASFLLPALGTGAARVDWKWGFGAGGREIASQVLPQFPDDPKTRIIKDDLVTITVDELSELMSIAVEFNSGKLAAFFCVTFSPITSTSISTPTSAAVTAFTEDNTAGVDFEEAGNLSQQDYNSLLKILLGGDYSSRESATSSTRKFLTTFKKLECTNFCKDILVITNYDTNTSGSAIKRALGQEKGEINVLKPRKKVK